MTSAAKSNRTARELVVDCVAEHSRMKCIAASVIGDPTDAEDVVQQAYAIAIEKNPDFATRDLFLGWLVGIVKNCGLNLRRKKQRRKTSPADPVNLQEMVGKEPTKPKGFFDSNDARSLEEAFDDDVLNALQKIAIDARICLLLRTVEQLSYKEIAQLLKIPEGTAMSMVHRSRKSLRDSLAHHEFAQMPNQGESHE